MLLFYSLIKDNFVLNRNITMKKIFSYSAIALAGLIMVSCGSGDKKSESTVDHSNHNTEAPAMESATTEAAPASATSNTVTVESNDQMKYNVSELKVKAGEPVSLTLKHVGTMKKEVMGHNLVILKTGTDVAAFTELALKAKDSEYIPNSQDIIAHTKLIGGGEEDKIEFTLEPGTYDFICTFPGHSGIMKGKIIAE